MTSFDLPSFLKGPNAVTLGIRASTQKFGRSTIQCTTGTTAQESQGFGLPTRPSSVLGSVLGTAVRPFNSPIKIL